MRRHIEAAIALSAISLLAAPAALAQRRDPDTAIKFSFPTPGARSLAMGGAFIALADDATAAYTNPAGLTNLTVGGSEVAMELRYFRYTNSFVDRGSFSSIPELESGPTGRGVDLDGPGLVRDTARSETSGISFLSFAYVLPRGLTLAFYRHELGNFTTAFQTHGPFNEDECFGLQPDRPNGLCTYRFQPRRSRTELELVNYGFSGAYEFELPLGGFESALSLGLGVSYYELDLLAFEEFFDIGRFDDRDSVLDAREPGNFYGPANYSAGNLSFDSLDLGDGDAFGFNAGFLWKLGREQRWSVGGVFRQGPDFETARDFRDCRLAEDDPDDEFAPITTACEFDDSLEFGVFTVPDVYGLGLAYRTAEGRTKITLDFNRVRYSQRLADFTAGLIPTDDPDFDPQFDLDPSDVRIADADQIHLGFERLILVVESLFVGSVRFGAWLEPFHELEYFGDSEDLGAFIRRPQDDEIHFTFGFGLAIEEGYQIDLAVDLAEPANTFSFSVVKFL